MTTYIAEEDTPADFDISYDDRVPQRELTDFVVTRGNEKVTICTLDDHKEGDIALIGRGTIVDRNNKTLKVQTAPLTDWCIEYGGTPNLWIRSKKVWYRLKRPAKEYARVHEFARRRFELCARIYILATSMERSNCTYPLFTSLLSSPYLKMKGYSERELLMEKVFILQQMENLSDLKLSEIPFLRDLKMKAPPKKSSSSSKKRDSSAGNGSSSSTNPTTNAKWEPSGVLDKEGISRLMKRAEKAVNQIYKHKNAWPFQQPVDPVKDKIPNYFDLIKRPMDYGTVKKGIEKGQYSKVVDVVRDMRQVAKNCCDFNTETHSYSIWALELQRKFESLVKNGEDAEIAAMKKRESNKKRKASDALSTSGKAGKKVAKMPKKSGTTTKTVVVDQSSVESGSPVKEENTLGLKICARTGSNACTKYQVAGSKYCSDECGMEVARVRIAELTKAGFSVDDYIAAGITKSLVHSRS